jgi:hypothetical protein
MSKGIQLVLDRLQKRPAIGGYHPNISPWKVIIHPQNNDAYIKREYTTKEKAERFALKESKKHPYTKITVECIILQKS